MMIYNRIYGVNSAIMRSHGRYFLSYLDTHFNYVENELENGGVLEKWLAENMISLIRNMEVEGADLSEWTFSVFGYFNWTMNSYSDID